MMKSVILVVVLAVSSSVLSQEQDPAKKYALETQPSVAEKYILANANYYVECQGKDIPESDKNLLTNLKWLKDGDEIPKCTGGDDGPKVCTEGVTGSISLYVKDIKPDYSGTYTCTGTFTDTIDLEVSQKLIVERDITWVNCKESQNLVLGTRGNIQCEVLANPPATIDWQDQRSNTIANNEKYQIEGNGLTIKNVSLADSGTYTIEAKVLTKGRYKAKSINVKIHVPPTITSPPEDVIAIESKEARMQCVAEGDPKPKIIWLNQDRSELHEMTEDYTVDQNTGELIIKSIRKDQEGEYTCRADNEAGMREAKAKLTVVIMPKIERLLNVTVDQYSKAVIKCASSGDPAPKITIKKVGDEISEDSGRITLMPAKSEEGWTVVQLIISNVSRSDDGLYSCVSENQGGQVESKGHITVQHAPLMYETPSTEVITWNENPVNITCVARSIPNATIEWWFQGQMLESESRGFKVYGNGPYSVLNIEKPTQQHYGIYTCKANNQLGTNETAITLKEVGIPGRLMQAIITKITATTLTIKITPPNVDGGTIVTGYIGEYKEVRSEDWEVKKWNAVLDSVILDGLTPGKEYDFRFAAQNIVGTGDFIDVTRTKMPEKAPPEPPSVITKNPSSVSFSPYPSKFRVSWSVPQDNGEPIKNFHINYYKVKNDTGKWTKNSDFEEVSVENDGSNHYILEKLSPETFYKVEIRAQNKLGYSQSSTAIYRTAKDDGSGIKKELSSVDRKSDDKNLKTAEVVGIIIGILVIVLIIVDVSCCLMKKCGLTLFVCTKLNGGDKSDEKNKQILEENGKTSETEPLNNGDKSVEAANEDSAMMKGDQAKENDGLEVNGANTDTKTPKDSAV